jgi:predicted negative regulator of RcsB-dependent stress response
MSALSNLVPLLILVLLLALAGLIGYACYTVANDVANKASKSMEKRHMSITKDGMVVGVKERNEENYVDQTQR